MSLLVVERAILCTFGMATASVTHILIWRLLEVRSTSELLCSISIFLWSSSSVLHTPMIPSWNEKKNYKAIEEIIFIHYRPVWPRFDRKVSTQLLGLIFKILLLLLQCQRVLEIRLTFNLTIEARQRKSGLLSSSMHMLLGTNWAN